MTRNARIASLICSHIAAVAIGGAAVSWLAQDNSIFDVPLHDEAAKDAVRIAARQKHKSVDQIMKTYRLTAMELADRLCIGFEPTVGILDGNFAICYPNNSPNAGPTLHSMGQETPVR